MPSDGALPRSRGFPFGLVHLGVVQCGKNDG
jgi:hypothetical protein